jgi:hypothetical protein
MLTWTTTCLILAAVSAVLLEFFRETDAVRAESKPRTALSWLHRRRGIRGGNAATGGAMLFKGRTSAAGYSPRNRVASRLLPF